MNNTYLGKKRSHLSWMPRTLIAIIVALLAVGYFFEIFTCYVIAFMVIAYAFLERIVISSAGVRYKRKFFKWDAIKTIGVAVNKSGAPPVFFKTLYISLAEHIKPVHIVSVRRYYYDNQYNSVPSNIELETDQDYIIKVSFNIRLILHLMAYWGTDINNLNDTVGWKSYIKLYRLLHR